MNINILQSTCINTNMNISNITSEMHLNYAIILYHLLYGIVLLYFMGNCNQELPLYKLAHISKEQ